MKLSFQKPIFWISFTILSLCGVLYTYKFFSQAFPLVNLNITLNRDQAINKAQELANQREWGPQNPFNAVSFDTDEQTKTFIELEGGGQQAFVTMLTKHLYEPYLWHVRLFKQFEVNEAHVYFTPDGKPYGFKEIIAEQTDLPSLKKQEALELILTTLERDWHINMQPYALIETPKSIQRNGRIDRTFVFERSDISLKDGRYRLRVTVSGNKITEMRHLVKVPELFSLRYINMRSYNDAIAMAGSMFAYIVYLLLGCFVGIFILLRRNWIIWQTPVKWALLIATCDALMTFDSLPLLWMSYQTEDSMYGFLLQITVQALSYFFVRFVMITLIFITAESLTRAAFGNHIQLWHSWSPNIASSYEILGRTIGGYMMVPLDLTFLVTFYIITTQKFGWWTPISQLVDPNVLAHYFPWFSSIVLSLGAGFIEECKFRAIPLASAALLGKRFGKKRLWIAAAFIIQALVFSAVHANYPAQPAYARLVELIIPSFIFGLIYLRFGLLTSVISHYCYDVILFALPIFCSQTSGIWINQLGVIFFLLLPLWIVLYRLFQNKKLYSVPVQAYNNAWQPSRLQVMIQPPQTTRIQPLPRKLYYTLLAAACLSIIAWVLMTPFSSDSPALAISTQDATVIAQQNLLEHAPTLIASHKAYSQLRLNYSDDTHMKLQHCYVWQTYGKNLYHSLLGNYLNPPCILTRFLRFDGTLIERSQEYQTCIGSDGKGAYGPINWTHAIPEASPGVTLSKQDARTLAQQTLINNGYMLENLYEIKAKPQQLPERVDWTFTFGNKKTDLIKEGELRIVVSITGDLVTQVRKKVHVPEEFKRTYQNNQTITKSLQTLCYQFAWILFICGLIYALLLLAYKQLSLILVAQGILAFMLLFSSSIINNWPTVIAQFNTQAPLLNQLLSTYGILIIRYIIRATVFGSVLGVSLAYKERYRYASTKQTIVTGVTTGVMLHALLAMLELLKPSVEPLRASLRGIAQFLPMLAYITSYLLEYVSYALAFTLLAIFINRITNYGTKRLLIALGVCVCISLTTLGMQSLEVVWFWFMSSIILAICMFVLWYYIIRFSYEAIIITVATTFCLSITQQMMFNVIAHNYSINIITILCIIGLAAYWLHIHRKYTQTGMR